MIRIVPATKQLTIRSISARLRAALEREARRRGQSLNKTVLALLAERLGLTESAAPIEYDDLDELAGTWSKSEATRFDENLHAQRQVDPKLWR
ncbi:MAG: antitoxin [Myxococcota bacterium]|nr:antitoxin [Myxococcota bacterium]